MEHNLAKQEILEGKAILGIEFGSTRIKAVLIGSDHTPLASGSHDWENRYENGYWTYSLDDIWEGLRDCYRNMTLDVKAQYGVPVKRLGAIGFSAMMHGYMAFDKEGTLLVPFRTWRNTTTGEAAEKLTELFQYNIPRDGASPICTRPCWAGKRMWKRWILSRHWQDISTGSFPVKKCWASGTLPGCSPLTWRRKTITAK